MIKDILVNLTVEVPRDVSGDYALSVATAFGAHLTGIAFACEPVIPGSVLDPTAIASVIDAERAERRRVANFARDAFEKAARLSAVRTDARVIESGAAGAGDLFGRLARNYDLSIVGQPQPSSGLLVELVVEAALFNSGRPVLVVPYIQRTGLALNHVMVCWDGSRSAARAVGDAMPLLERASAIDVVTIDSRERRNELVSFDIAEHLARHGLKVELKQIVAKDPDVASTILSYAADNESDLIVMGGYGHSRLREFVLGGATRGVLGAMTVPTLMAH